MQTTVTPRTLIYICHEKHQAAIILFSKLHFSHFADEYGHDETTIWFVCPICNQEHKITI